MNSRGFAAIVLLLVAATAGCGDAPTGMEAAGPRLNGYVIGSGNRSDSTAAPAAAQGDSVPGNEAAADPGTESTADGGYVIGSGN